MENLKKKKIFENKNFHLGYVSRLDMTWVFELKNPIEYFIKPWQNTYIYNQLGEIYKMV
jgi:hypothetical protein